MEREQARHIGPAAIVTAVLLTAAVGSSRAHTYQTQGAPSALAQTLEHPPSLLPGTKPTIIGGYASSWDPNAAPFGSPRSSLADAESDLGYNLVTPDVEAAYDATLTHAWVGSEAPGGPDMLPDHALATVALAYGSGIQVTYVPWVYGVDAPAFSERGAASSYEIAASQHRSLSTDSVDGIPVLVEASGHGSPNSVEFNLGTRNADAMTIAVIGEASAATLKTVAGSIIGRWTAVQADPQSFVSTYAT